MYAAAAAVAVNAPQTHFCFHVCVCVWPQDVPSLETSSTSAAWTLIVHRAHTVVTPV